MTAALILVSLFEWEGAMELLLQNNQCEKAALLLSACRFYGVPINDDILYLTQIHVQLVVFFSIEITRIISWLIISTALQNYGK